MTTRSTEKADERIAYRVQGLSCGNCAREMEGEIRRLKHGEDATLSYNSGTLKISKDIDVAAVKRILRTDGAKLVESGGRAAASAASAPVQGHIQCACDGHDHEHSHEGHSHAGHSHSHSHSHSDE